MIRVIIALALLIASSAHAAIENLDEMDARKSRRATNTFYHGATAGNNYVRQPQSLMYSDTRTGHEVWVLSSNNNQANVFYTDISPANPWSADGARLGFFSSSPPSSYSVIFGSGLGPNGEMGNPYVMRSDGSYIRDAGGSANRGYGSVGFSYFVWSPVIPNAYYTIGGAYNGLSLERYSLYKNTVADTATTYSKLVQLSANTADQFNTRKSISSDGKIIPARKGGGIDTMYFPTQVYPENETHVLTSTGWSEQRGQTNEWAGGSPFACSHDEYMPSSSFMILLFSMDCYNVGPVFYKYNLAGTDTDGGPDFDPSETTYATFNSKEVEPLWTAGSETLTNVPWKLEKDTQPSYHWWGHPGFDRWGRTVTFNDGNGYWYPNGSTEWAGPVSWDYVNRTLVAEPGATQPQTLTRTGGSYTDHNAWSDYFAYSKNGATDPDTERWVLTAQYDKLTDANDIRYVSYHYQNKNGSGNYEWTSNNRVAQSPDGTKISYAITFLTNVPNTGDMAYAVAYYPHPPEITSVTGSGTYTIRFDWRLATANPRGYTKRGWPNEATNHPPPPRETKAFRLWRSSTGTGDWEPVTTVDANIFGRYNFSDGTWSGNDYWTVADSPGAGTWYYAVTSIEHSGLESRTLSNVFSTAGAQSVAYPNDPKGEAGVISTYNPSIIRNYNIYAADGETPAVSQNKRIASIAASSGATSYVDWLGKTDGTTRYVVTAVDTQGNESSPLSGTSYTAQPTAGQYLISFSGGGEPPSGGGGGTINNLGGASFHRGGGGTITSVQ